MDFIQTANKQVDKFGAGKHGFSAGNPSGGIPATYMSPAWCDNIQQELANAIEGAGIAINPASQSQLLQAIQALILSGGADYKASVRAATTANIASLAGGAPNAIDGVTLAASDRVLVKDQTTPSQNGLYYVDTLGTGANGTWIRATDADGAGELTSGANVSVEEGTAYADSQWMLTTDGPISVGTTALIFTRKGIASSLSNIVRYTAAGAGTYTKPSNVTMILIRCVGAGGGAGGDYGDYGGGGGGGAGGFCEKLITAPAASYAYTVGAGGAGGASAGAGYLGGNTTIAGMTASGGGEGHTGTGYGGVGGAAAGGSLNIPGGGGSGGSPRSVSSAYSSGGCGGSSFWGGGGRAGGASGVSGGSGAAGGGGGGPGTGGSAGAGGAGMIEIWEFI